MARFAYGKGKRKTYWDVEQLGRALRTHDVGPVSAMLPGYRVFGSETAARAELERLVAAQIAKGFVPDDDDARAMAAAVGEPDAKPPAVTLPIRHDTSVYNEATGFMVTSMDMAGKTLDEGSKKWNKAVADGKMIPISLIQDAAPSTLVFEMSTRFEKDNASLVTTRLRDARDDLAKKTYKQPVVDGEIKDMLERHNQRKAQLAAIHGPPIPVVQTHEGLAQAVEAALKKQYGG